MTNTTDTPLAYKVKTTAPKLYCVRPNASIIEPGATVEVSIILQGFNSPLPIDYKCKDKFLLVSLPCPELSDSSKVSDYWTTLEAQYKDQIVSKKLRVNYIIDGSSHESASSAPDAAVSSGIPSTGAAAAASGIAAASQVDKAQHPADLQRELDELTSQINSLAQKLDSNENSPSEKVPEPSKDLAVAGISLPFAIILILLAFILGWVLL